MLIAELRGKGMKEVQNNEDYLTSCVFDHLCYLPPSVFWEQFLSLAVTVPIEGISKSLTQLLAKQQIEISRYNQLCVHFWPAHPRFGEPDLALVFSGSGMRSAVIFFEAKLWAEKSGLGDNDQLGRYLKSCCDLSSFNPPMPSSSFVALVYLTPRESLAEVTETIAFHAEAEARDLLFRIQWQDVIVAAEESLLKIRDPSYRLILSNVAAFLRRRGLEYFKGFSKNLCLPLLSRGETAFYSREDTLFSMRGIPEVFLVERGAWTK